MSMAILTFYAEGSYTTGDSENMIEYSTRASSVWIATDSGWKTVHTNWAPYGGGSGIPKIQKLKNYANQKPRTFLGFFYFKQSGFDIINFNPGNDEIAAETVKSNPILAESSGLKFKIEADDKNIYSLIPIPPKEKTEKIDESIKIMIISK